MIVDDNTVIIGSGMETQLWYVVVTLRLQRKAEVDYLSISPFFLCLISRVVKSRSVLVLTL